MHRYTSVYQQCIEEFAKQGISPNIIQTARSETIISTVAEGEAVSLMPRSTTALYRQKGLTAVSLDPPVPLNVVLAKKKRRAATPLEREFILAISL